MQRLIGHVRITKLTPEQVERAYNQLQLEGHTAGGVRAVRTVFRIAMREAEKKGFVTRNVAALADGPKAKKREKDPLTIAEVKAIRARMTNDRLMALFFVGLALGLREAEAFGLRWRDVDLDAGTLQVSKQIQRIKGGGFVFDDLKTEASHAILELTPGQIIMLKEQRRRLVKERMIAGSAWQEHDLVFPSPLGTPLDASLGTPLDASNVRKHFHKVCAEARVPPRRIHDWRVTVASWLADLNVHPDTAMRVTRHGQSNTLMEYYTKSGSEPRRAAIAALDELFNG